MPRRASRGHLVSSKTTKKKPHIQRETLKPPTTIPRNVMGRRDTRDSAFITEWLKNRKRSAPLKIYPRTTTNKKKEGEEDHITPVSGCDGIPSHRIRGSCLYHHLCQYCKH